MEIVAQAKELLGSRIEIKLPSQAAHLFPACFAELRRIEDTYSRFLDASLLSRLNRNLGVWQDAPPEFIRLLLRAKEFNEKTRGQFDVTLKATLDALGYDKEYSFKPKPASKEAAHVGEGFLADEKKGRVLLNRQVEFGGLGKGFALDQVSALLREEGVQHYSVDAGGDLFAEQAPGEDPWVVLLEHPDDATRALGQIELDGFAIAGSSGNRRKWGAGAGYHHLINAHTRKPATGVKAIFVTARTGIEADAYATALFCAGFEEGRVLAGRLPVEALFVSSADQMFLTPGFQGKLFE